MIIKQFLEEPQVMHSTETKQWSSTLQEQVTTGMSIQL